MKPGRIILLLSLGSLAWWCFFNIRNLPHGQIDHFPGNGRDLQEESKRPLGCLGWRATFDCIAHGRRDPGLDLECDETVKSGSGYCLCEGGVVANREDCGYHSFKCSEKCAAVDYPSPQLDRLPEPVACAGESLRLERQQWFRPNTWTGRQPENTTVLRSNAQALWEPVWQLLKASNHSLEQVHAPGVRTQRNDFVLVGFRMATRDVKSARLQLRAFLDGAPAYPGPARVNGRGLVMVGGGLAYLVPAWATVLHLRRLGCQLPIEMWFPAGEYPEPGMAAELRSLGVVCRPLPRDVQGFAVKPVALLLSQFKEILFLDADNLPLHDPTPLFDDPAFRRHGALLWKDFWSSSAAPDLLRILDIPAGRAPGHTFESGQMMFDKSRTWKALQLAVFFNVHSQLYYDLFTNFMGKGDKESFAMALLAVGQDYTVAGKPPGSVGMWLKHCRQADMNKQRSGWQTGELPCDQRFYGNSMLQYDVSGRALFMHANMKPKINLAIPNSFDDFNRRWVWMEPEDVGFEQWSRQELGLDLEHEVWQYLRLLRCLPGFDAYIAARQQMGDTGVTAIQGLHTVPSGIDLLHWYQEGLRGSFQSWIGLHFSDHLLYVKSVIRHSIHSARHRSPTS